MDILDIIVENIESKDNEALHKLVKYYIKEGKNKFTFLSFMINLYSSSYITKNLWVLRELGIIISQVEKKNTPLQSLLNLTLLINSQDHKHFNLYIKGKCYQSEKPMIDRFLYSFSKEYHDLQEFKNYMHEDAYSLINILYHSIAYGSDLPDCFVIIRYLLNCKKKEVLVGDHYKDIIDVLFLIVIKYIENNRLPEDVKEYVILCKDIFYYRCKQKDKIVRINLLFHAIFIIMQRKTKFQEVRYQEECKGMPSERHSSVDYLYVLTKYDSDVGRIVKNDREMAKLSKRDQKMIKVDNWKHENESSFNVIKVT